jgi:ATP-binding cassette subfamily B multidrug efflux pump
MMKATNVKKLDWDTQVKTVKRIARLIRPYWFLVFLSIVSAALSVVGQLYIPILTGRGIDYMLGQGRVDFAGVKTIIEEIILVAALSGLGQWLLGESNNRITYNVSRNLRDHLAQKIQTLPLSYLDQHPTGDLVSRMIADIDLFTDGLLMGFTQFFTGVLTIIGTLVFMIKVNLPIALVVVGITPLSFVVAAFIAKKSYRYFREQSSIRGEQTALINERIEGVQVVQSFGHEAANLQDFDELNDKLCASSLKAVFYSSITNPATRFVNSIVFTGVALVGSLYAIAGGITVGDLSCFLTYANQYTKPFNEISGVVTEMQNAVSCAARVFEFMDAKDQEPDAPEALALTPAQVDGRVAIRQMAFSYVPGKELIRDFNLDVAPGQRIAIVGPTGCGKTTFINLLMRFYDIQAGSISVAGTETRQITRKSLRRSFGMVLQDTWLKTGTILENIAYGKPSASREEVVAAAKAAHADGFIRRMPQGYETVIGEDGGSISQGQKQLLCIARVMLCLPPMLILDEATSSIDTRTEILIQKAFATMMQGRTSFIVAHRLSTIREADAILVMREGRIVESGTHEKLLAAKGFYANLYNSQFAGVAI